MRDLSDHLRSPICKTGPDYSDPMHVDAVERMARKLGDARDTIDGLRSQLVDRTAELAEAIGNDVARERSAAKQGGILGAQSALATRPSIEGFRIMELEAENTRLRKQLAELHGVIGCQQRLAGL